MLFLNQTNTSIDLTTNANAAAANTSTTGGAAVNNNELNQQTALNMS
jgi:hypothetical protein